MGIYDEKGCSFNSTLVQLKAYRFKPIIFHIKSFNSTLVQLKGVNPTPAALMEQSFNSTLVQLKVEIPSLILAYY